VFDIVGPNLVPAKQLQPTFRKGREDAHQRQTEDGVADRPDGQLRARARLSVAEIVEKKEEKKEEKDKGEGR
jgi:hypothetical protein